MRIIKEHLTLKKPRFICRDTSQRYELIMPLSHAVGSPARATDLDKLNRIAGSEAEWLLPLYSEFNGIIFHQHGDTAGLIVASVEQLEDLNNEWREWFQDMEPEELYDFQREGFAFASIAASANFLWFTRGESITRTMMAGTIVFGERIWSFSLKAR